MFTVIGAIFTGIILIWLSLGAWFSLFHGGEEFSAPKGTHLIPPILFTLFVIWLWYLYFSSFTLIIN